MKNENITIPANYWQHYLQNVYFFCGSACSGKTTMSRAFATKHGFHWLSEDMLNELYAKLADPIYQPSFFMQPVPGDIAAWECHFMRPVEEYSAWLDSNFNELLPLALIEASHLAKEKPVAIDCHLPIGCSVLDVILPNRIVFLVTDPQRASQEALRRPDHLGLNSFVESLPHRKEIRQNLERLYLFTATNYLEFIKNSGRTYIMRDERSTVENTLKLIEQHFGLL